MHKLALSTATALMLLGGTALAGEVTVGMQALGPKGPVADIGQIKLSDGPDGVVIDIDLVDLPPGPNRFYLYESANCKIGSDDMIGSQLSVLNVETDEDGAEPLKKTLTVAGLSLGEMTGHALVIARVGKDVELKRLSDAGSPTNAACGVVR